MWILQQNFEFLLEKIDCLNGQFGKCITDIQTQFLQLPSVSFALFSPVYVTYVTCMLHSMKKNPDQLNISCQQFPIINGNIFENFCAAVYMTLIFKYIK